MGHSNMIIFHPPISTTCYHSLPLLHHSTVITLSPLGHYTTVITLFPCHHTPKLISPPCVLLYFDLAIVGAAHWCYHLNIFYAALINYAWCILVLAAGPSMSTAAVVITQRQLPYMDCACPFWNICVAFSCGPIIIYSYTTCRWAGVPLPGSQTNHAQLTLTSSAHLIQAFVNMTHSSSSSTSTSIYHYDWQLMFLCCIIWGRIQANVCVWVTDIHT